jgi:plasmid maintenance system antidote protein VapI
MMTGNDLRQHIDRLGLTYTEAAQRLGLSLSGLNHQMRGERPVSRQTEIVLEQLERGCTAAPVQSPRIDGER